MSPHISTYSTKWALKERDEHIYHEHLTHVPMFAGSCRRVLICGGGNGAAVRDVLKYPAGRPIGGWAWPDRHLDSYLHSTLSGSALLSVAEVEEVFVIEIDSKVTAVAQRRPQIFCGEV